jgi:AcrR family transcriptional regulator
MRATDGRARSRARSHARIERTALELFRASGFDQVTVEDVCAAARVAPATFYRHFGSKDEVVFAYRDDFTAVLREAVEKAADLPERERLPAILCDFAGFLEGQRELLAVRDEIVVGHPRLLQRTLAVQRDFEAVLAEGMASQRGLSAPDSAALLEAGVGMVVLRVALRMWRAEGGGGSLLEATRRGLAELTALVGAAQDLQSFDR